MSRKDEIIKAVEEYYNEVKYLSDLSAFPIAAFKVGLAIEVMKENNPYEN